jgi:hypothetical protein
MQPRWKTPLAALLVFTLTALVDSGETEFADAQVRLRVLSYNIHHGEDSTLGSRPRDWTRRTR